MKYVVIRRNKSCEFEGYGFHPSVGLWGRNPDFFKVFKDHDEAKEFARNNKAVIMFSEYAFRMFERQNGMITTHPAMMES